MGEDVVVRTISACTWTPAQYTTCEGEAVSPYVSFEHRERDWSPQVVPLRIRRVVYLKTL